MKSQRLPLLAVTVLLTCAPVAFGSDWNGTANWSTPANWSNPAGLPAGGSTINVQSGTLTLDAASGAQSMNDTNISAGAAFVIAGGNYTAGNVSANGNWTVNGGGTYTANGWFDIRNNAALSISGTGTTFSKNGGGDMWVGEAGNATMNVTAGATFNLNGAVLGAGRGATGTINVDASTMNVAAGQSVQLGGGSVVGTGNMSLTNGAVVNLGAGAAIHLGTSWGTSLGHRGNLTITDSQILGGGGDILTGLSNVGGAGGTITQTNSTVNVRNIILGMQNTSTGNTYTMNSGTLTTSGFLKVGGNDTGGVTASGSFIHNNGSVTVGGELWVGEGIGSTASYDLKAGSLTVNNWLAVARDGATASLNQTGGTLTKAGANHTIIGSLGGTGTYNLSAGTYGGGGLEVRLGESGAGLNGSGTFALSGAGAASNISQLIVGWNGANTSGTLTVAGGASLGVNGNILLGDGGGGTMTVNGGSVMAGGLILDNGAAGVVVDTLNLNGGTLSLGATGLSGNATTSTFQANLNGGTLRATSAFAINSAPATLGGVVTFDTNGLSITQNANSPFSGTGGITKTGVGTLNLNATNTYTGAVTVSGGTLVLNQAGSTNSAVPSDGVAGTTDLTINGGAVQISASEQIGNNATIAMSSGTFSFGGSGLTETIGQLNNSGGNFSTGANTLTGTGATITWAGGTNTINAGGTVSDTHWVVTGGTNTVEGGATGGTLQVLAPAGSPTALHFGGTASPTITLNSDATSAGRILLQNDVFVDNTLTSGTAQILSGGAAANPGSIDLSGALRTFDVFDGSATDDLLITAQIQNGGLLKTNAGTLTLNRNNTFAGGTTISAGAIRFGTAGALGTGTVTLNDASTGTNSTSLLATFGNGGTPITNNIVVANQGTGTATIGSTTFNPGAQATLYTGTLTLNKATTLTAGNTDRTTYTNVISGNVGTLTVTGGARTTLEANNTFVGDVTVTQSGTILQVGPAGNQIPDASNLTLATGTFFRLNADGEAINALNGTGGTIENVVGANTLTVGSNNGTGTFSGVLQNGSGALTLLKVGSGSQTLNGASTYTGGTTVRAGSLLIGNGAGAGVGTVTLNDASTGASNASFLATGPYTVSNPITISNNGTGGSTIGTTSFNVGSVPTIFTNTITLNKATTFQSGNQDRTSYTGIITGAGAITITGTDPGSVGTNTNRTTFDNNGNNFTGPISIVGANTKLQLNNTNVIPDTVDVDVGTGAFLYFNTVSETIDGLSGAGTVQKHPGVGGLTTFTVGGGNATATFSGAINNGGGSVALVKIGTGVQYLDGASNYTGTTAVNGGYLVVRHANALGSAVGGTTVASGATLQLENGGGGDVNIASEAVSITGDGVGGARGALASWTGNNTWGGSVTMTGNSSVFVNTGSLAVNGVISGGFNMTKTGAGNLILGGTSANTYSGTTVVDNGVLTLNKTPGNFAIVGPVQMGGGNTNQPHLRMSQNNQFGPGVVMTFVNAAGGWTRFDLQGTSQTLAGLQSNAAGGVIQNERLGGGGTTAPGTLTLDGSGTYTYNGWIRDEDDGGSTYPLSLIKNGTGTQTIANTGAGVGARTYYTGQTTVNNGTLVLQDLNGAQGTAFNSPIAVNAAGVLEINSSTPFSTRWNYNKALTGTGVINKTGTGVFGITGTNNFAGTINVLAGRMHNDNVTGNWSGSTADVNVSAGAVLDLRANDIRVDSLSGAGEIWNSHSAGGNIDDLIVGVADGNGNYSGIIRGNDTQGDDNPDAAFLRLVKNGTGTQILSGANTYAGGSTINLGTLSAENTSGSATGTGLVTVNTGGRLAGNGTVGSVSANAGGAVSAGLSGGDGVIGTLATGALSLATNSTFRFDLNTTSLISDLVNTSGNLTLGSSSLLTVADLGGTTLHDHSFTMIDYSGSWNGGTFSVGGTPVPDDGVFALGSNWLRVDYNEGTAVVLEIFAGEIKVTDTTAAVELTDAQAAQVNYGGTTIGNPVVRNFLIENAGSQGNLFIDQITVPAGYSLTSPAVPPTLATPVILTPGQSLAVTIQLTAAGDGEFVGDVVIASNDETENPFSFPVTGFVVNVTPAAQSVDATLAATFTATSLPVGYTYAWDHDGNPLATTTSSHTIDPVKLISAGTYTATVTSPLGSVASDFGVLTVTIPPADAIIASTGTLPTGVPGGSFQSLRPGPKVNEPGQVAFRGWLTIGTGGVSSTDDTGIWYQDSGSALQLAAREGDAAAGVADLYGSFNFNPAWLDSGAYAFSAYLVTNHSGIWTSSGGAPTPELVAGDLAPGLAGETVATFANPVHMGNSGQLATKMSLTTGVAGVTAYTDGAIVYGTPGSLSVIAREGSPAGGTAGKFAGLLSTDWLSLDDNGRLIFAATLASQTTPVAINTYNNTGLWLYDGGTTTVVARGGDPVTDLSGLVYLAPRWGVISQGKVAFRSTLRGAVVPGVNDQILSSGLPGALNTMARTGVPSGIGSPAGVAGASYSVLGYPRICRSPAAEVVFRAEMKAGVGGVTLTDNEGLWKESGGSIQLLVREGQASPIPGLTFGAIGEPYGGENGQVVFSARVVGLGVTASNDTGLFCEQSDGSFRLMLREGDSLLTDGGLRTVGDVQNTYIYPEDNRALNSNGVLVLQAPFVGGHTALVRMVVP